jgi:hypothetical protein
MADARVDLRGAKAICQAVRHGGDTILTWEWDDRFQAALSSFPRNHRSKIHAVLEESFGAGWDATSIRGAAPAVVQIAESFGGLWPGQELFVSAANRAVATCACWWPWGDGETISVRIALVTDSAPAAKRPALLAEFRKWFAV